MTVRVVCYLNQFYAGMGGEEAAGLEPTVRPGALGPATKLGELLGEGTEVVGTVVCGDNAYGERTEACRAACLALVRDLRPDLFVAGPAFNAGRYGLACGDLCAAVGEELGILTLTALHPENPGVELYRRRTFIGPAPESAAGMRDTLARTAALARKLVSGEPLGPARLEGYLHRGIRKGFPQEVNAAERGVALLLDKLAGRPFRTELEMPSFKKIPPAPPLKDLSRAVLALVTSGGVVPQGNPDRIRVSSAESWGRYDVSTLDRMTPETFESVHGGYDRTWANRDPNVVVPLDGLRELEREGVIGGIHRMFYTTTGTGTAVAQAERFGREIGEELKAAGVDGAILTAT